MSGPNTKRTCLYQQHQAAGAKLVPFAGWEMPVNYGSQVEEHNQVRNAAGMFDVSHMTVTDFSGADCLEFLQGIIANDVGSLASGEAQYGLLLNEQAGVIDDLITYRTEQGYRVISNAGTRDTVLSWFAQRMAHCQTEYKSQRSDFTVHFAEQDLGMIAVQGPEAIARFEAATGATGLAEMAGFTFRLSDNVMIARTGYTGEEGVEVVLPGDQAQTLWQNLLAAGVQPAGLGARDTLRCEAGLNLYGQDMDERINPLAANLAWTIAWEPASRDFVGRQALAAIRAAKPTEKLTGLVMQDKGILRQGQTVITDHGQGVITSGIFSPTLGYSVALARVPRAAKGTAQVDIRGKLKNVNLVRPPFVRAGKRVFK